MIYINHYHFILFILIYLLTAITAFIYVHKSKRVNHENKKVIVKQRKLKNVLRVKKEILEMIVKKEPLEQIFNKLVSMIEEYSSGANASIMLADEQKESLHHVASIKLPKDYLEAIHTLQIREGSGVCGTAAYRKQTVTVLDMLKDPLFARYRELTEQSSFARTCTSTPILSSKNEILGTFTLFYGDDKLTFEEDQELVEAACNLVVLAIENKQMEEKLLQKTEEKYQLIINNISDLILLVNVENEERKFIEYASPSVRNMLGIESKKMINANPIDWVQEEDKHKVIDMRNRVLTRNEAEQADIRLVDVNGSIVNVEAKYIPISNQENKITNILIVGRDITERKKMYDEIEGMKEHLINVVNQQHGMTFKFIEKDGKLIYTFVGGQLIHTLGLSEEAILGKDIHQIFVDFPSVCNQIAAANRRAWNGELNVHYEVELPGIVFMCTLQPIRKNGRVIEVIGTGIDISDRKRMEAALTESEEKYRSLVELSPEAIFVQRDGVILYANSAAAQLLDVKDVDTLIGQLGYDFIHPEDKENIVNIHSKVSGKEKHYLPEYKIVSRNRSVKYMEAVSISIQYDGAPAVQTVARDVSARKQAEAALRESEQQHRLITENMNDLITVTTLSGEIQYASPSHLRVLGIPLQQFNQFDFSDFVHLDDIHLFLDAMSTISSLGNQQQFEARVQHADGRWLFFEVHAMLIHCKNQDLSQILWVARDITEKKKTEEKLRKTDKLTVVGELAAGVAHEIRNPLTTLKGFVQMLESEPSKIASYLPVMNDEIERINYITNEFLALAQPQTKSFSQANMEELIHSAVLLVKAGFDSKQIEIKSMIEPDVLPIFCSKEQIKQMLINVLTNSYEAIEGRGKIIIAVKMVDDHNVSISISDSGRGIAQDRIAKLCEPHYSNSEKGTGIGLMVSYKIIKDHNGSISIMSEEGKGTTVQINLPTSPLHTTDDLENTISKLSMLTNREKDVLTLIGKGKSNKEIALDLKISESTVKNHITSIFNKLGISDRSQAIVLLYQKELI